MRTTAAGGWLALVEQPGAVTCTVHLDPSTSREPRALDPYSNRIITSLAADWSLGRDERHPQLPLWATIPT